MDESLKPTLLTLWQQELHSNPKLAENSKELLNTLLHTIETKTIPSISAQSLEPILVMWHQLLKQQHHAGLSVKDTAMLLLSLKTTLSRSMEDGTLNNEPKLTTLVDMLSVFSFELYSAQQEQVIEKQNNQIEYLQTNRTLPPYNTLLGESPQMQAVYKAMDLVLDNDITVLLQGESGTGKDVIATAIHEHSKRNKKPFITLNCGAIPKELIESELFGHEKGSFTGAQERRLGKFELADGGTLFLDEIAELPLDLQVKLLRVLQNKEIERVGGSQKISINARIIAATNQDLNTAVKKGAFRLDLFYRLNVYPIHIPSLRERKEDIVMLALHFLHLYSHQFKTPAQTLTADAQQFLLAQKWEGNVRELENMMQRAALLSKTKDVSADILSWQPGKLTQATPAQPLALPLRTIVPLATLEAQALTTALKITGGNIKQAAIELGISRTTFYNKAKLYSLPLDEAKN